MKQSNETRDYNIGKSDYAQHKIQPWDIWKEYNLNPWDADIVKRVLRTKEGEARSLDYEKIIHICRERIRQIAEEATAKKEPVLEYRKPPIDEGGASEEDEFTVYVQCERSKPPMVAYPYCESVKYGVYGVFASRGTWYAYLGYEDGANVYLRLDSTPGSRRLTKYDGFPEYTFRLGKVTLGGPFRHHEGTLEKTIKLGGHGKNYEKGEYIISHGRLYRFMGIREFLDKGKYVTGYKYIEMLGDCCFEEAISLSKIHNEAVQQVKTDLLK
nr:MAG TPA: hypothetical protein [Caudoviricetes sp.]